MIVHIALFKWKVGTNQQTIDNAFYQLKQLKEKCEGIIDIFCGKNYHKESKGFTYGVVVIAQDQKALDLYRQHPDHGAIAKSIDKIEEDGIGFDFKDL